MKYQFEIKEKAIGKGRPRVNTRTGKVYTPEATKSFEEKVKWAFTQKYNIATEPSIKPFRADILVEMKPADSLSKKKKDELRFTHYTKKPDVDNIAKIILDSLNKIAYKDDSQVAELRVYKRYGLDNKINVILEEI